MKLYQQLILFVLAATAIPLLVGFFILRHNEEGLEARLLTARQESAVRLAEAIAREVREVLERVQGALGYVSLEQMSKDELGGLLGILYKQSEDIVEVALLDEGGVEVVPSVYLEKPEQYPEYAGRLPVSAAQHQQFIQGLPLPKAHDAPMGTVVLGSPRLLPESDIVVLSFVVPLDLAAHQARQFAAIELSLQRTARQVLDAGETRGFSALLVDEQGRVIARSDSREGPSLQDLSTHPAVLRLRGGDERGAFFDSEALFSFAKVPLLGWGAALSQPKAEALDEVRRARRVTVAWTGVSILALLLLGGLFTGRITSNLRRFMTGAQEFSRGNLDARIEIRSRDELGVLANTFNQMGQDLRASRAEIERWNRELAQRVEERTRELELAHRRLLETSKLAAIGQLGAGVAHEINNPLVGILGNIQLLLMKRAAGGDDVEVLKKVEASAKRCKEVIQNLQRFSEQEEDPEHQECSLRTVLLDAHSLTEQRLKIQGIATVWALPEDVPEVLGDHRQLVQVFFNLFANARTAMPKGGTLTVAARRPGNGLIEVEVKDTGKGIPPEHLDRIFEPFFTTKDEWTNTGLGLSVVYRIVADHGGKIDVESEVGQGTTFRVNLPLPGGQR